MIQTRSIAIVLALFLMLLLAGGASAQNGNVKLAVVASPGASGDPSTYHFTPDEGEDSQGITHVFTLKNETKASITISRIDASCSCTTAVIQAGGASQSAPGGNVTLAPGEEAKLKVSVSFGDGAMGPIDKMVMVHVENQTGPAVTLHVAGTIEPLVMFSPTSLDFGTLEAGKEHLLIFTVGISPRGPSLGDNPVPVSSVPYLKIAPSNGPMPKPDFPNNYRILAFQATLSADAPMGPFEGTIHFASAAQTAPAPGGTALVFGAGSSQTTQAVTPAAAPDAGLPVRGEITGDLAASPKTAVFGTVTAGRPMAALVTITSKSGKDLSQMTFSGDQPWLSAHIASGPDASGAWTVQIGIAGSAPAGAQSASVTGDLAREKIVIPVLAYIVSEK